VSGPGLFDTVAAAANSLNRVWTQPCRLTNHDMNGACPTFGCTPDGVGGNYIPWEGLVFDLGGPSNKVAIFAENDHGPQPCESLEYTVYLTDNPLSRELINTPTTTGADPQKWNRAVLSKVFTEGFVKARATDPVNHAACGDTNLYSVEEDSFVQVFSLPCGITFRYAAVVAGNDGLDFPACAYDSSEAELDAVAGLTEDGANVCPDMDGDGYVDCNCPSKPAVCDCNDADPNIHPSAPEACDAPDVNCDGKPGACTAGLSCYESTCVPGCSDKGEQCPFGSSCTQTPGGMLCVPSDCTVGNCPAGSVCDAGSKKCVPACDGVVCPQGQKCVSGACIDPCASIVCPGSLTCQDGKCSPACSCFASDVGCSGGKVCDRNVSNTCVQPSCKGVQCDIGQTCDPVSGACVDACAGVVCPQDGNPCTDDICVGGLCTHQPKDNGASCEDADKCNGTETCQQGVCTAGPKPMCDDKNPCTADFCDPTKGCVTQPLPDGKACATGNLCIPGACKTGTCETMGTGDCDDGDSCTKDMCDMASGCSHTPISGCTMGSGGASGSSGAAGKGGAAGNSTGGASGASGSNAGGASGAAGKGGASGSNAGGASGTAGKGTAGTAGTAGKSSTAGAAGTTGVGTGGASDTSAASSDSGGCGCRAAGEAPTGQTGGLAGLALALGVALRRRTRRALAAGPGPQASCRWRGWFCSHPEGWRRDTVAEVRPGCPGMKCRGFAQDG
jgi:MYXO-CTERM domain-containing protein